MQRELRFILRFRSDASRALKATANQLVKMGVAAKGASKAVKGLATNLIFAASAGGKAGSVIGTAMTKISVGASRALVLLRTMATTLAALGLGIGLAAAVITVAQFGQAMSRVQAITGELERDLSGNLNPTFAAINDTVRRLGATTVFTASQAAQGFGLLAQAGFSAGESIEAVASVLNLAVVGAIDLASSASIVADAIRGFGLDASEAGRVADVFAATITRSNTNVTQLGEALKFVAPISAALGVSLEETAAAIGLLSDAGLKGTLAGTGLRRAMIGLAAQTPKAGKVLKKVGVDVDALQKKIDGGGGLVEALKEFEGRSLSAAQAVDVFGLRGGPAFLILQRLTEEAGSFAEALKLAEGRAEEFAAVARDNLTGDLKLLRSIIEDVILGTGGMDSAFRGIVQTMTGVIKVFAGVEDPLNENAARFREIATNIKTVVKALKTFVIAVIALKVLAVANALGAGLALVFLEIATASSVAAGAMAAFGSALIATGIGALVIALGFGVAAFIKWNAEVSLATGQIESMNKTVERTEKILERTTKLVGKAAIEQLPALKEAFSQIEAEVAATNKTLAGFRKEIQIVGQTGDVFGSKQLTTFQKIEATFKGIFLGSTIGAEGVRILTKEMQMLARGGQPAVETLARTAAEVERVGNIQAAQKVLTEINNKVEKLRDSLEETNKAIAAFAGTADESFKDFAIEIGDLKLGSGVAADLQRAINEELRDTGLDIAIPEGLAQQQVLATKALTAAKKELELAEIAAAAAGVEGGEDLLNNAKALVAGAKGTIETIETTIKARERDRAQIIKNVTAVQNQIIANKAEDAARKRALKTLKALTMERNRFAKGTSDLLKDMQFEKTLIGLTTDERELAIFSRELESKAAKAQIGDIEGVVGALVKERAELLRLQKVGPGVQKTLSNAFREMADEATNVSTIAQKGFDAFFDAFDDQIRNFVKTGQVNMREFALTVLDELAFLAIKAGSVKLFETILGQIPGTADIVSQLTGAAGGAAAVAGGLPGAEAAGGGPLAAIGSALGTVKDSAVDAFDFLKESAASGFGFLKDSAMGAFDILKEGAAFIGTGLQDAGGAVLGGIGDVAGVAGTAVQELGENTLEVFRTGFTGLKEIGEAGLEQGLDIAKFLGTGIKTGFQFLLTGFTSVIGFLGTLLTTVFTAASTAAAFIVSGAVTVGSFLVAAAVQTGALLMQGAQLIGNIILGIMQGLLAIMAIFAPIPFFSKGGISDRPGRTGRIPVGAFRPMAGFAGGGSTGDDTIPAMLAPGEAVVPLQGGAIPVQLTVPAGGGQGSGGGNFSVVVNIQTADLESFRDSEQEIQSTMGEAIRQAQMRDR